MADGFKETEIARQLGRTPSWVSERLSELRTEILLQNGLLPPLTDAEYAALKQSLSLYGQQTPIIVNAELKLIDGGHRLRACTELEIAPKYIVIAGLTDDEEWELAVALNASRRQMTRQQKRKLIEHELMRDPNRSDRRIAAMCGVHGETVAAARAEITAAGDAWANQQLPRLEQPHAPGPAPERDVPVSATTTLVKAARRTDTLGRRQHARKPPRPAATRTLGQARCGCCGELVTINRTGSVYGLEPAA